MWRSVVSKCTTSRLLRCTPSFDTIESSVVGFGVQGSGFRVVLVRCTPSFFTIESVRMACGSKFRFQGSGWRQSRGDSGFRVEEVWGGIRVQGGGSLGG